MRTDAVLYILVNILLIQVPVVQTGSSACLVDMTSQDYAKNGYYFRYCNGDDVMKRQRERQPMSCGDKDRFKLTNFDAYVPMNPKETKCQLSSLRYNQKEDTGCLSQPRRDAIIAPFMAALSGKTPVQAKSLGTLDKIPSGGHKYKQVVLEVGCETESNLKMDMCSPNSKVFHGKANVSLYFDFDTFMENGNHSSCFCYFKTFNTTRRISIRAFDIRLHEQLITLSLDSYQLDSDRIYWWQTGVLSSSFSVLTLSGLTPTNVPISVWMDVYGKNMNITCDIKPLEIEGLVTSTPQKFGSSSAGGLSSVYIAIIVIASIVLIVIVLVVIKTVQSRMSNAAQSGAYKVDDPYASENFISSTYEQGEDPPSPHGSMVVYSKVGNTTSFTSQSQGSRKCRKGGESDESRLYEFDSESERDDDDDVINNGVDSMQHKIAHDALVHDRPKEQPPTDGSSDPTTNIYDHFRDHPDVIPTTNNIYDTTGTGIYSSFRTPRQQSMPDDTYS